MKKAAFILLLVVCATAPRAQVQFQLDSLSKPMTLLVTIDKGWHVYAQDDTALQLEGVHVVAGDRTVALTAKTVAVNDVVFEKTLPVYRDSVRFALPQFSKIHIDAFAGSAEEFKPVTFDWQAAQHASVATTINIDQPVASCGDTRNTQSQSLFITFLLGLLGGFIALLTPCVFPMIPVTVSFFGAKSSSRAVAIRRSLLYGGTIAGVYLLISLPFHFIGGIDPQIFNTIATNAYVNLVFFFVFLFFALSFFGLFDIKLPSAIANAAGSKSGTIFMALTLVIVSFSCTGIILGSLLVRALSSGGGAWELTMGLGGFGIALALPFTFFALFPSLLKKMPKSGGWLEQFKKVLAFAELALAVKYFSNADLVEHWGILKRETFLLCWALIALALALYLLNAFRKFRPLNTVRVVSALVALAASAYLFNGLRPAVKLDALSGFPPPASYSWYKESDDGRIKADVINNYEEAVALSVKTGKPLLIDFTGWACVNCRKMEELVWTKPEVAKIIQDNYILVSLYVDDRASLPDGSTVGEKWANFQSTTFKQVTQPLYALVSPRGELLNHPVGYTPDASSYAAWLTCGLHANQSPLTQRLP